MTQEIIEEYMVTDGKPMLVKKTVVKKEAPPDLTALKVLERFYKMPDATEIDLKGELNKNIMESLHLYEQYGITTNKEN